jgi:hypothetical protein
MSCTLPLDMLGDLAKANTRVARPEDVVPHEYLLYLVASLLGRVVAKPESQTHPRASIARKSPY